MNRRIERVQRVLRFVVGTQDPEIASKLSAHGYSEETLHEGLELVARAMQARQAPAEGVSPELIKAFDAFENRWFPIARYALMRHHRELAQAFFTNLERTDGVTTIGTVSLFVERVEALEAGAYGEQSADARQLLAARGLTAEVLTQARALLAELGTMPPHYEDRSADEVAAIDAVWQWYLEWSGIARVVIKKRHLLRKLGFRRGQPEEAVSAATPAPTENPSGSPSSA